MSTSIRVSPKREAAGKYKCSSLRNIASLGVSFKTQRERDYELMLTARARGLQSLARSGRLYLSRCKSDVQ